MGGGSRPGCDLHRLHRHCHSALQEVRAKEKERESLNFEEFFKRIVLGE